MTAVTMQEYTLHLPQDVVEMLQRAASLRHETPDEIVAEALRLSLQPLRKKALQNLKAQVLRQSVQGDAQRREHINVQLTAEEQLRLSALLTQNREEGLTDVEQTELQMLYDRIESVATEKAAAIYLLSGKNADSGAIR